MKWDEQLKLWVNPRDGRPLSIQPRVVKKYDGLREAQANVSKAYAKKNKVTYC